MSRYHLMAMVVDKCCEERAGTCLDKQYCTKIWSRACGDCWKGKEDISEVEFLCWIKRFLALLDK